MSCDSFHTDFHRSSLRCTDHLDKVALYLASPEFHSAAIFCYSSSLSFRDTMFSSPSLKNKQQQKQISVTLLFSLFTVLGAGGGKFQFGSNLLYSIIKWMYQCLLRKKILICHTPAYQIFHGVRSHNSWQITKQKQPPSKETLWLKWRTVSEHDWKVMISGSGF